MESSKYTAPTRTSTPPTPPSKQTAEISTEDIIGKLCLSLTREGDFPTSAKVVSELRALATDPRTTANQITEVILREPSLGIRILHIVNSSFYRRSTPIMTVSQAVLRIGMKQLAELCAGLVLLQKFIPAARKDGSFATCLRKAVITPLLTTSLAQEVQPIKDKNGQNEGGFLSGLFCELGVLLLAFYYPEIYDSAVKRSNSKNQPISQSLKEIVGLSSYQISDRVLKALELPEYYEHVMSQAEAPKPLKEISVPSNLQKTVFYTSQSVSAAHEISAAICEGGDKAKLDQVINKIKDKIQLDIKSIETAVGRLPEMFKEHCASLDLDLQGIPSFVSQYNEDQATAASMESQESSLKNDEVFSKYVDEIRAAVDNGEPTASIITTVMETLAWGLHFNRVFLLLVDGAKKSLRGRMFLGTASFDPKSVVRPITPDLSPCDVRAFTSGRCVFHGEAVIVDGWPFAAIPIGFDDRCVGVIYADKTNSKDLELNSREQAAVGVLAELLDRSIVVNVR
jgi:HD-like signal output (HDOD) protein